jgi:hypothetical protein
VELFHDRRLNAAGRGRHRSDRRSLAELAVSPRRGSCGSNRRRRTNRAGARSSRSNVQTAAARVLRASPEVRLTQARRGCDTCTLDSEFGGPWSLDQDPQVVWLRLERKASVPGLPVAGPVSRSRVQGRSWSDQGLSEVPLPSARMPLSRRRCGARPERTLPTSMKATGIPGEPTGGPRLRQRLEQPHLGPRWDWRGSGRGEDQGRP